MIERGKAHRVVIEGDHVSREWSCEHCGRPTRDAPRKCDECGCGMCGECTDEHDAYPEAGHGLCPAEVCAAGGPRD